MRLLLQELRIAIAIVLVNHSGEYFKVLMQTGIIAIICAVTLCICIYWWNSVSGFHELGAGRHQW